METRGNDSERPEFGPESAGQASLSGPAVDPAPRDWRVDFLPEAGAGEKPPDAETPAASPLRIRRARRPATRRHNRSTDTTVYVFLCGVGVGALLVWLMQPYPDAITPTDIAASVPVTAVNAPVAAAPASTAAADVMKAERSETAPAAPPPPPAVAAKAVPETTHAIARSNRTSAALARSPAPASARPPRFRGLLAVESRPAGARVTLNGQPVGTTPLVLTNLDVGSRAVRLTLEGYQPWTSAVRVVANQKTNLSATLQPAPDAADGP